MEGSKGIRDHGIVIFESQYNMRNPLANWKIYIFLDSFLAELCQDDREFCYMEPILLNGKLDAAYDDTTKEM